MREIAAITIIFAAFMLVLEPLMASNTYGKAQGSVHKVPRYASIRSNKVNARVGPGRHYPVKWTFVKKHYPILIIRQYNEWRMIQDIDGQKGWIHHSLLSSLRTVLFQKDFTVLRSEPDKNSVIIARIEKGVIGMIIRQRNGWVNVKFDQYKGWVIVDKLWGL